MLPHVIIKLMRSLCERRWVYNNHFNIGNLHWISCKFRVLGVHNSQQCLVYLIPSAWNGRLSFHARWVDLSKTQREDLALSFDANVWYPHEVLVAKGRPRVQTANITYHLVQAWCDLVLAVVIHHNQNLQMGLHFLVASSAAIERTAELVGMFHKYMSQRRFFDDVPFKFSTNF